MRQRAIDDTEKLARRNAILAAALALYLDNSRELPSVSRIATASGLAKGTVYLYFKTKEEIFLALLDQGFSHLLDGVDAILALPHPDQSGLIGAFVGRYVDLLRSQTGFLRLAGMANSVIEQNLPQDVARNFKLALMDRLLRTGAKLDGILPEGPVGQGASLLLRCYAITIGLWQMLDWPENVRQMLADDAFSLLRPDFFEELGATLTQLFNGAIRPDADTGAASTSDLPRLP